MARKTSASKQVLRSTTKRRKCLKCSEEFESVDAANRICPGCSKGRGRSKTVHGQDAIHHRMKGFRD